jgi:DNA-directed RNA polymerase subunit alpha
MEDVVSANWRNLIRPKNVERDPRSNRVYGKFVVRPLERGFGVTLGNALRRVLLSSLQGAAVTKVAIGGVLHEFSAVPGVVEDVTDIVLNLKGVRVRLSGHEAVVGQIDKVGVAGDGLVVRAGDLAFVDEKSGRDLVADGAVEVLNPDHVVASLTAGGRFSASITVALGKGYVPGSMENVKDELGTIPVDALYSPVMKVRYSVTDARVGQRTDFDRLTLEVWTDGSIRPEDAVGFAAKVLKEQLQVFINFTEDAEPGGIELSGSSEDWDENLFKRVDELELSVRSANCLQNAGIEFIWQLVERSEAEMLKTKNFGRKSLNEIKEILSELGLSLGMKLHNFPKHQAGGR